MESLEMLELSDFSDPRYLNEVGWFLYYVKQTYKNDIAAYSEERKISSQMLLEEVTTLARKDLSWISDKTVLSIGCGCTGDLSVWPATAKIALDPLLYTYQKLGMLIEDEPGTSRTLYLSLGVADLPLLDDSVDLVLCRNALDHMPDPRIGMQQVWRVLKPDGVLFLSVDIGGEATADEPSPFSEESLRALLNEQMEVMVHHRDSKPHADWRDYSVRIVARKRWAPYTILDKVEILRKYEGSFGDAQ
jgi:SAM-dependent methyltransferase